MRAGLTTENQCPVFRRGRPSRSFFFKKKVVKTEVWVDSTISFSAPLGDLRNNEQALIPFPLEQSLLLSSENLAYADATERIQ